MYSRRQIVFILSHKLSLFSATSPCPRGSFWCPESNSSHPVCIPRDGVCNGSTECPDTQADERVCMGRPKTPKWRHSIRMFGHIRCLMCLVQLSTSHKRATQLERLMKLWVSVSRSLSQSCHFSLLTQHSLLFYTHIKTVMVGDFFQAVLVTKALFCCRKPRSSYGSTKFWFCKLNSVYWHKDSWR